MGNDVSAGRSTGTSSQSYDGYREECFLRKARYARYICTDERRSCIRRLWAAPRGRAYRPWHSVFGTPLVCGVNSGAEARTAGENVTSLMNSSARRRLEIGSSATRHCMTSKQWAAFREYSPPAAPRALEFYFYAHYARRSGRAPAMKMNMQLSPEIPARYVAPWDCSASVHKSATALNIAVNSGSTTCGYR